MVHSGFAKKWLNGEFYVMWILPRFLKTIKSKKRWELESPPGAVVFRPSAADREPLWEQWEARPVPQTPEQALYIHPLQQP